MISPKPYKGGIYLIVFKNPSARICSEKSSVALGVFDGLHRGHMQLIKKVTSFRGLSSVIFSINPVEGVKVKNHPHVRITSLRQNEKILAASGVDILVLQDLDRGFSLLGPDEFFTRYILEVLNAKTLTVGFNYRFCKDASCDTQVLAQLCIKHGVELNVVEAFKLNGLAVSSSVIKGFVASGELDSAAEFLGRPFAIMSEVVEGRRQGRSLGFPTANMKPDSSVLLPPDGVYITRICVGGAYFDSITNIGAKPTFEDYTKSVEIHIIGFSGDIYGCVAEVEFYKKIRDTVAFESVCALKNQLEIDRAVAVEYFNKKECRLQNR